MVASLQSFLSSGERNLGMQFQMLFVGLCFSPGWFIFFRPWLYLSPDKKYIISYYWVIGHYGEITSDLASSPQFPFTGKVIYPLAFKWCTATDWGRKDGCPCRPAQESGGSMMPVPLIQMSVSIWRRPEKAGMVRILGSVSLETLQYPWIPSLPEARCRDLSRDNRHVCVEPICTAKSRAALPGNAVAS